ncbi:TPA: hypothetical protein ROR20_002483 [Escherichia coli]|nr:hypothetical protein [Escherichia coli]ELO5015593.1 hypothetical protein [Escherichia coli]HDX5525371.1 hypothetical protein [Escherichia coli]
MKRNDKILHYEELN